MLSATDEKYINLAAKESEKSTLLSKHGCIAVANGKIQGKGYNSSRTRSQDGFIKNSCSCHAEIAALRSVFHNNYSNTFGKYGQQIKVG